MRTVALLAVALLLAAWLWRAAGDQGGTWEHMGWDLTLLSARWQVPEAVLRQLDPAGPRFQTVMVGSPAYCYPPADRVGRVFPQVLVRATLDLKEGAAVKCEVASSAAGHL